MAEYQGRGAWSSKGVGGTLKPLKKVVVPGPYYMLHPNPLGQVGAKAWLFNLIGQPVELNELATYHGVIAIQVLVNQLGFQCPISGVFTVETDQAVKGAQAKLGLKADGVVGQTTMKALINPVAAKIAKALMDIDPKPLYGILQNEGAYDPGAVGYFDANDLGLAQINILSHPNVTISNAFCPSFAIKFIADKIAYGVNEFHDIELAVASYNLGITGTKEWVRLGMPNEWVPSWATKPRNTREYINRILK